MSTEGGTRAIIAALIANLGIAATKFVAWGLTGSSSMLAESIHSVADSGNQLLLLIGGRRSQRRATPEHPFGYGRERYIYAFIVSIVLFTVGGLFALYEGYHKVSHPEPIDSWQWVPITVLVVAIGLETYSFNTAIRESNHVRKDTPWKDFVRHAKAPELPVVLLEDAAALIGLVLALFGVGMTLITGNGVWDGVGTLAIGVLLVCIAVFLAVETKSLLLGEAASVENIRAIERALIDHGGPEDGSVERIIHMKTMHLGPDELLVAAKIAVRHDDTARDVARAIDAAETRIRSVVPIARVIYLEPDIYRTGSSTPDEPPETAESAGRAETPGEVERAEAAGQAGTAGQTEPAGTADRAGSTGAADRAGTADTTEPAGAADRAGSTGAADRAGTADTTGSAGAADRAGTADTTEVEH